MSISSLVKSDLQICITAYRRGQSKNNMSQCNKLNKLAKLKEQTLNLEVFSIAGRWSRLYIFRLCIFIICYVEVDVLKKTLQRTMSSLNQFSQVPWNRVSDGYRP